MKKKLLYILTIFISFGVQGQTVKNDLELSIYNNQQVIQAPISITLKNGFHIPAGNTVLISIAGIPNILSSPTTGQNFILTRTFRDSIKMNQLANQRTIDKESQSIQYLDGLGRPSQSVQLMGSPSYKDVVQHFEYDAFGRESKKYLPYSSPSKSNGTDKDGSFKSTAGNDVLNFYSANGGWDPSVSRTPNPYSVTVFENSPLNRVQQQGSPGASWQPAADRSTVDPLAATGHTVSTDYDTNTGSEVKLWQITYTGTVPTGAKAPGKYGPGKLYKMTTKDENWTSGKGGTVEEFKDFEGRIILKRVWKGEKVNDALDTYYVYDDFGDLRYVIPPLVTADFLESSADFANYVYAYRYDGIRRLVEKKIPGKGWEYLIYNKNDQVILTQDALQRLKKEWSYIRYEAMGRVASSGLYTNTTAAQSSRLQIQQLADATASQWESRSSADYPTVATTFPLAGDNITIKQMVTNYYDDYSFTGNATAGLGFTGTKKSTRVNSLLTGSRVTLDDGTVPMLSIYYYDDYGRVIQSSSQNQFVASGGTDVITNSYLFSGELKTSKRVHRPSTGGALTTILTTNTYDHVGRLVEIKKKVNTQPEIMQSQLSYNEIGQLKQKNLHVSANTAAQEIVYGYNERGWLNKINDPSAVNAKQVFGMELSYGDKVDTYNGNIGTMKWNTQVTTGMSLKPVQSYTYSYDKLNMLSRGSYRNEDKIIANNKAGFFDEELRYDNMGNIDSLRRTNGSITLSNNFKYAYEGHRLTKVTDSATSTRTNGFSYDINGNATTNTRLGITKIDYNYLNLPVKFTKGSQNLVYRYSALGQKLTKELGTAKTDYVNGIQYKNGQIEFIQTEEGRIVPNGSSFIYEYFLQDHLGNTRAVVDHSGIIKQIQDYYPFGMEMNQGNALNTASNLYKYNGKEKQVEMGLDQFDYGARFYDAEIGRWNAVDPLAENNFSLSYYVYAANNPALNIDPDGKDFVINYGNNQKFVFNGQNYKDAPNDQFIQNFLLMYNYNVSNGGAANTLSIATDSKYQVEVEKVNYDGSSYGPASNKISWNPSTALITENDVVLSPASIFEHEADHAKSYNDNPTKYIERKNTPAGKNKNKEEERVLNGSEQVVAKANGELRGKDVTRRFYSNSGKGFYETINPTSVTPRFDLRRSMKNIQFRNDGIDIPTPFKNSADFWKNINKLK